MSEAPGKLQPAEEILAAQRDIVETFQFFGDWTERYQYIIDLGRQAPPFPEEWKTDKYKLHGCQSQVWIVTERRGDLLHYEATSDSAIVAGLIQLLLSVYSDRRPADILATPPDFLKDIELAEHLSPTRSNGLHAMVQQIRQHAVQAMVEAG
ncbi:MAG: SufE family protein [Gammaproteobacteria bacterium]|jgi:cysteine desulfuration protein SufE|nr:SufE family protein [Gammaproteobacteria bacterium]